jgi:hypothetical protein
MAGLDVVFAEAAAHHRAGHAAEAEAGYRAVLAVQPEHLGALSNLGSLLRGLDRVEEAAELLDAAVAVAPPNDPRPLVNLANLRRLTGRWVQAAALYDELAAMDALSAETRLDASLAYLAAGRDAEGWRLQDQRPNLQIRRGQGIAGAEWRGEPLERRTVLLLPEQGFGDQIQMIRYAPLMKARGAAHLTVVAPPPLVRLFEAMPAVDAVISCAPDETVRAPPHDVWTTPFSLPLWLGAPPAPPYLAVSDAARARWQGFGEGRIGVVWHGARHQPIERWRGLPSFGVLAPLARYGLVDLQEPRGDFADTAAIIEQLDLVITTDTAMAHLAGALGRPCLVMLPYIAMDWRWADGRRTPWYPRSRLYRQPAPGDWASVVDAIARDLGEAAAGA